MRIIQSPLNSGSSGQYKVKIVTKPTKDELKQRKKEPEKKTVKEPAENSPAAVKK